MSPFARTAGPHMPLRGPRAVDEAFLLQLLTEHPEGVALSELASVFRARFGRDCADDIALVVRLLAPSGHVFTTFSAAGDIVLNHRRFQPAAAAPAAARDVLSPGPSTASPAPAAAGGVVVHNPDDSCSSFYGFIPAEASGYVIGKGGTGANEIFSVCGVRFEVEARPTPSATQQRIKFLAGSRAQAEECARLVDVRVRDCLSIRQAKRPPFHHTRDDDGGSAAAGHGHVFPAFASALHEHPSFTMDSPPPTFADTLTLIMCTLAGHGDTPITLTDLCGEFSASYLKQLLLFEDVGRESRPVDLLVVLRSLARDVVIVNLGDGLPGVKLTRDAAAKYRPSAKQPWQRIVVYPPSDACPVGFYGYIPSEVAGYVIGSGGSGSKEVLSKCGVKFEVEPKETPASAYQRIKLFTMRAADAYKCAMLVNGRVQSCLAYKSSTSASGVTVTNYPGIVIGTSGVPGGPGMGYSAALM